MTDGNTYAINKPLDEREDYDALQEVTAELEQAEARIEELEGKLAKALELAEEAFEFNIEDDGPRAWHSINDRIAELKGQDDE